MSKSPTEYLKHILVEIAFLEKEVTDYSEDQFMHDEVKQRAFARSLEIIGEAVKMVPDDFRSHHPKVDWKSFAGLRDKLIHHYFGVDYSLVWDVVKNELPDLKEKIHVILQAVPPQGLKFQKALSTLIRIIDASIKLTSQEKEKLYKQIYIQIRKIAETILVVHMPKETLNKLTDQPESLTLSSYANLIITTIRDPKTAPELEAALTGLVGDIAKTINPKL